MEPTVPIAIAAAAVFLLALGAVADDRRTRIRRREAEDPVIDPPLVHSINDDRCIGCEACVDACPTEVLELVDHKARVIRFTDCVQCEQCANACPTTAMVMYRLGQAPQTLTVPELDDHFQTGVPGQYLIGEVAGKPLVKNAANLGRAVVEHITRDLAARGPAAAGVLDVAVVGSGPGGLSAGLTCLRNKLSCVVIEKEHVLASTVARYPKGKLFMAEPVDSGNVSYLPVFDATKEALVAAWQKVVDGSKLPVKLGEAVDTVVRGDDGVFEIKTTVATYRARAVILATGLRGKPRLLAVPGANLEKVQSRLDDPDAFAGQHVLVVGGGDSAVEAAMSMADVGATVTLSYRGDGFKRCKQGNQKRLAEMSDQISVLLESNVQEFVPDAVTIKLKDGSSSTIPNQQAFVLIGADTPVAWLTNNNVRFVEREHLYALGSTEATVRKLVPNAHECPKDPAEALANLFGSQPSRPSHGKLKSMVDRAADEFRDVMTSVSKVFRLSDLEDRSGSKPGIKRLDNKTRTGIKALPDRARTRTPASGVGRADPRPLNKRPAVIPAERLTKRPVAPPKPYPIVRPTDNPFVDEPSVPIVKRVSNPFEPDPTVNMPAYGKRREVPEPQDRTTLETPSLRELVRRDVANARPNNPFTNDKTTIARTPSRPENPFQDDGTTSTRDAEAGPTDEMPSLRKMADTSVDAPAVRRAAPPPTPPRTAAARKSTEFPVEPTSYATMYQTSEVRGLPPLPRPSPTSYSIVRPPRMPRGTAVPPPLPVTRKPR